VDLSGIIFVVLAVAWAVYLIPKALKHHDEVARTRSIDRFSSAMRVLARREPVNRRDARLVVPAPRTRSSAAATDSVPEVAAATTPETAGEPSVLTVSMRPAVPRARLEARRTAARAAARRRRHILTFLLLCDVAVAVVAYLGVVSWWAMAAPGALTVLYLVLCRTQVRRESLADFDVLAGRSGVDGDTSPQPATEVTEVVEVVQARVDEDGVADFDDTEDTVGIPVALLEAVAVQTTDGGTLWDPLPVTLPTYVTKPQARRTVRTIDLGEPGTWTSGHTVEDTRIAAQAEAGDAKTAAAEKAEAHRAVGS
jgi:hypothetical protein